MPAPLRAEYVTIDGFPIPCLAVECASLLPLWEGPDVRGSDVVIPHADGVRSRRRRPTASRRLLKLTILGYYGMDDLPSTNVRETLEANIDYVRANVADPTGVGDGTRTAVLYLPSGATRTGPVTVESFKLGELGPTSVTAALELVLPEGALA